MLKIIWFKSKDSSLASIVSSSNMAATSLSFDSLGVDWGWNRIRLRLLKGQWQPWWITGTVKHFCTKIDLIPRGETLYGSCHPNLLCSFGIYRPWKVLPCIMKNETSVGKEERHAWDFDYRYFYFLFPKDINYFRIKVAPAWIETDYSKDRHFRWKIKWRLEHLSALGIVGECATKIRQWSWSRDAN